MQTNLRISLFSLLSSPVSGGLIFCFRKTVCSIHFQSQKIDRLNSQFSSSVCMSTLICPNSDGLFCHIPLLVRMNEKRSVQTSKYGFLIFLPWETGSYIEPFLPYPADMAFQTRPHARAWAGGCYVGAPPCPRSEQPVWHRTERNRQALRKRFNLHLLDICQVNVKSSEKNTLFLKSEVLKRNWQ